MSFQAEVTQNASESQIALVGAIDENCRLPQIKTKKISMNLNGVTSVNSEGVRLWATWVKNLKPGTDVELHHCPAAFINKLGELAGFSLEFVRIESFYVPYFCESCGAEETLLFEHGVHFQDINAINVNESIICPVCSSSMKLDVVKENYFAFLKRRSA